MVVPGVFSNRRRSPPVHWADVPRKIGTRSHAVRPRACLKIGGMPNGERFFAQGHVISVRQQSLAPKERRSADPMNDMGPAANGYPIANQGKFSQAGWLGICRQVCRGPFLWAEADARQENLTQSGGKRSADWAF